MDHYDLEERIELGVQRELRRLGRKRRVWWVATSAILVISIPVIVGAALPSKTFNTGDPLLAVDIQSMWDAIRTLESGAVGKFVDGTNTADAVYTAGNVGIRNTNPQASLDIAGHVSLQHDSATGYRNWIETNNDNDVSMSFLAFHINTSATGGRLECARHRQHRGDEAAGDRDRLGERLCCSYVGCPAQKECSHYQERLDQNGQAPWCRLRVERQVARRRSVHGPSGPRCREGGPGSGAHNLGRQERGVCPAHGNSLSRPSKSSRHRTSGSPPSSKRFRLKYVGFADNYRWTAS